MIALLLSALSFAGDNRTELALEIGATHAPDPDFAVFSSREAAASYGARLGLGLSPDLSLLVDWQHSESGGIVGTESEGDFHSALTLDHLAVGPRVGIALGDTVVPYVTIQAEAIRGRVRFDEDINSTDEINQMKRSALTVGGLALAGAQILSGDASEKLRFSAHLEMGYGLAAPLSFGDFGSVAFHGFALRAGAGVMF